ncbi:hypothetical protein DNTS_030876, partial [Danionella cerebrum]
TKRSGLVRRLWRSRLIPDKDGGDGYGKSGEGSRDDLFGTNPEKIPKTEFRAMTPSGSPGLDYVEACTRNPTESGGGSTSGGFLDQDGGTVCAVASPRSVQDSDSRTVTCCLFKDRDHHSGSRSPEQGSCQFVLRNIGSSRDPGPLEGQETKPRSVMEQELKTATYSLLKRLKEKTLDTLLEAVESRGGMPSDCVMVSRTELRISGHMAPPQLLVCKLYRWSDLQHTVQLKALCECRSFGAQDGPLVCCNPYHYSRLCGPEAEGDWSPSPPLFSVDTHSSQSLMRVPMKMSPPPPYSRLSPSEEQKPLDLSDSTLSYTETEAASSPNVTQGEF